MYEFTRWLGKITLETYISQIVTKRAEQKQISNQFLVIMSNAQATAEDMQQLFVYNGYEPVPTENLLNKETIIELLCKIEILKTNYENVRNTFSDLYKPTHPRLVKIFSYIINFIRFRESQTGVIDEHYNSSERTKNMIEQLYHSNQEKEEQVQEMQQNRKNVEQAIKDKEKRNQELKTRLLELQKAQTVVTEKLERVKGEQARLKAFLEDAF